MTTLADFLAIVLPWTTLLFGLFLVPIDPFEK